MLKYKIPQIVTLTPIVALTAFAFESDKDRAIEAGCDDFLTKPVSQNALEKVLDKYVK